MCSVLGAIPEGMGRLFQYDKLKFGGANLNVRNRRMSSTLIS